MDFAHRPIAGASTFLLHMAASLLLLTGVGDAIWTHSCPGCFGPWSERAEPVPAGQEVYRVPLRLEQAPPCPHSRPLDREASLLPTSQLPVAPSPLMLCLRVGRDGSVESVRTAYGVPAYDGTEVALSEVRRLRFRPATWMGKPVPSWLPISIGANLEPPPVL
jgi:hypothetical protein